MIVVLAGGVGAARYLTGQLQVTPPSDVTAIVNVADDVNMHGLHVSPDIDTVIYTLSGAIDPERGWGLKGETWRALEALRSYGIDAWFNLGDRDIGTHMFRTMLLNSGVSLSEVTERLARARGMDCRIVPVSDDPIETRVTLASDAIAGTADSPRSYVAGEEIGFQEYFVRLAHDVAISGVRFAGIERARPAPGVLDAIADAQVVVIAPSNPIVSIGPILAVPGVRQALMARRERNVAVSPIVAGATLKGPADRMMDELGFESSVAGVAEIYRDVAGTLVIDNSDDRLASAVEDHGVRAVVTPTVMSSADVAAELARTTIGALEP